MKRRISLGLWAGVLAIGLATTVPAAPSSPDGGGFGERVAAVAAELQRLGKEELGRALLSDDPVRIYAALSVAPSLDVKVSQALLLQLLSSNENPAVRRAAALRYLLQYQQRGFQELGHRLIRQESGWQDVADLLGDLARSGKSVAENAKHALVECASGATQKSESGLRCIEELTLVPGKDVATALVNLSTNWSPVVKDQALAALKEREGKGLDVDAIINKPSEVELGAARVVHQGGTEAATKGDVVLPMTVAELVNWGLPSNFADYIRPGFSKTEVLIRLRKVGPQFARIRPGDPWANHPKLYDGMSYEPPSDLPAGMADNADYWERGPH